VAPPSAWDVDGDDAILSWSEDHGEPDWQELVSQFPGRTADELRRRSTWLDMRLLREFGEAKRSGRPFEEGEEFWSAVAERWPAPDAATTRGWEWVKQRYEVLTSVAGEQ
jgi:hypothetical protein